MPTPSDWSADIAIPACNFVTFQRSMSRTTEVTEVAEHDDLEVSSYGVDFDC